MRPPTPYPPATTGGPPRREDAALLQGHGRFVADLLPHDCLHIDFLRSPYPAGRIVTLDVTQAKAAPGVCAVLTGADIAGMGVSSTNPLLPGAPITPMQPLAQGRIAAAGQILAAVVATSPDLARDALDLIALDVQDAPLPFRPPLQAEWGAPVTLTDPVRVAFDLPTLAPMPLEPRAAVALPGPDGLTVWLSTQTPQRCRDDLCAMLHQPRDRLRVIAPDVGGAFGGKASLMPEDAVTAFAALTLQRPVKWVATRSDDFLSATQGRGATMSAAMDTDATGRATALQARLDFPLGHWTPHSALAPVRNAGRILPGPYAIPTHTTARARLTEGPAVNIYRGAGRPEAAMLLESLMDKAARRLGMDPVALRRRNLATPDGGPDRPCSGDYAALLDRLEAETGYPALRAAQSRDRAQGRITGIGVALYVEPCGQGWETASLTRAADGGFVALTGSSAQGQGRETAMAQIVADVLGLSPAQVQVRHGDSALIPDAIGALASRSTAIGGSAMWHAAHKMRAALAAPDAPATLTVTHRHEAKAEAWASGAVLAELTIDPDTGAPHLTRITWVDDAGTVINPMLVQGQLVGGAAQGIGAALMERMVYRDGQLLTGSLMDYAVPRATDIPPIHLHSQPVPSPANPLGVKGVGEAGCIGIPAAILNAARDALIPFDAPDLDLPLTPEKLWRAITGQLP